MEISLPDFEPFPCSPIGPLIYLQLQVVEDVKIDLHLAGKVLKRKAEIAAASSYFFKIRLRFHRACLGEFLILVQKSQSFLARRGI